MSTVTTPQATVKSDLPTTKDMLGFTPYCDALVSIISNAETPLVIGVFGQWGSGKTSLMRMIRSSLDTSPDHKALSVWFNAWKYDDEESLWRALFLHISSAIRESIEKEPSSRSDKEKDSKLSDLDRFEQSLYRTVEWEEFTRWSMDWLKAISRTTRFATDIALPFVPGAKPLVDAVKGIRKGIFGGKVDEQESASIADAFHREMIKHRRDQILLREQFERQFSGIVEQYIAPKRRLVIFIDDLDRCLPENIVKVLEAMKLFLDVKGCVFVLGFDREAVVDAVRQRYSDSQARGRQYLEKMIQVPFYLPPIERERMAEFLGELACDLPEGCCEVFSAGLRGNPREAKRVVNIFMLLWQLSQSQQDLREVISAIRLAKFVVIQYTCPGFYNLLRTTPRFLRELERFMLEDEAAARNKTERPAVDSSNLPEDLAPFADENTLRRILTAVPSECFSDRTLEEVSAYIYLTYRSPLAPQDRSQGYFPFEPEMIRIAGAEFTMGTDRTEISRIAERFSVNPDGIYVETPRHVVEIGDYEMGRFPVTNREYSAFIKDTGYIPPSHWENGTYQSDLSEHPVTDVCWHDANAYCAWLSAKTRRSYRLPTEAEWEYAARGDRGFFFPWGDEWDTRRCNTSEGRRGGTTPVELFVGRGPSWCGCADMAGNVLEWTHDSFEPYPGSTDAQTIYSSELRVLRGGSWHHSCDRARCTYRGCRKPDSMESWIGFRVACEP